MTDEKETFRELMQRWEQFQGMANHQERGKGFEVWLKDLFQAAGLEAVESFERKDPDAELDGAIHLDSNTYLLEAKWVQGPINADPFTKLKARVDGTTANAYGLLISVSGFNKNAVRRRKWNRLDLSRRGLIYQAQAEAIHRSGLMNQTPTTGTKSPRFF